MKRSVQNSVLQRINANRQRIEDARQREEREAAAMRESQHKKEPSETLLSRDEWASLGRTVVVPKRQARDVVNDNSPFHLHSIRFVFSEDQTRDTVEWLKEQEREQQR
jgi:hypothetical protein